MLEVLVLDNSCLLCELAHLLLLRLKVLLQLAKLLLVDSIVICL